MSIDFKLMCVNALNEAFVTTTEGDFKRNWSDALFTKFTQLPEKEQITLLQQQVLLHAYTSTKQDRADVLLKYVLTTPSLLSFLLNIKGNMSLIPFERIRKPSYQAIVDEACTNSTIPVHLIEKLSQYMCLTGTTKDLLKFQTLPPDTQKEMLVVWMNSKDYASINLTLKRLLMYVYSSSQLRSIFMRAVRADARTGYNSYSKRYSSTPTTWGLPCSKFSGGVYSWLCGIATNGADLRTFRIKALQFGNHDDVMKVWVDAGTWYWSELIDADGRNTLSDIDLREIAKNPNIIPRDVGAYGYDERYQQEFKQGLLPRILSDAEAKQNLINATSLGAPNYIYDLLELSEEQSNDVLLAQIHNAYSKINNAHIKFARTHSPKVLVAALLKYIRDASAEDLTSNTYVLQILKEPKLFIACENTFYNKLNDTYRITSREKSLLTTAWYNLYQVQDYKTKLTVCEKLSAHGVSIEQTIDILSVTSEFHHNDYVHVFLKCHSLSYYSSRSYKLSDDLLDTLTNLPDITRALIQAIEEIIPNSWYKDYTNLDIIKDTLKLHTIKTAAKEEIKDTPELADGLDLF